VKYFTWDEAKNEKLNAERAIGFEEIVFLIERGHVLTSLNTRTGNDTVVNGSSSSNVTTTCTSFPSSKTKS
jgi:uncharacterized DUF497 family protein